MRQKDNTTVYHCDYCNKHLLRKYAMVNHEKRCGNNPDNFTACSDCENLERVEIEVDFGYEKTIDLQGFRCKKKDVIMYPPILEHKNKIPEVTYFKSEEVIQERMPKKCDSFTCVF